MNITDDSLMAARDAAINCAISASNFRMKLVLHTKELMHSDPIPTLTMIRDDVAVLLELVDSAWATISPCLDWIKDANPLENKAGIIHVGELSYATAHEAAHRYCQITTLPAVFIQNVADWGIDKAVKSALGDRYDDVEPRRQLDTAIIGQLPNLPDLFGHNLQPMIEVEYTRTIAARMVIDKDAPVIHLVDREILTAMLELNAVDSDHRVEADYIARKAKPEGEANNIKKNMSQLKRLGLVYSKTGRGGGAWLTPSGIKRARGLID